MKLCKPSFEIIEQSSGLEGIYKQIEYAGRTCYKSSDKITEDSAKPFVDRMIKSQHYAMLEHGTIYLKIPYEMAWNCLCDNWVLDNYSTNPYTWVNGDGGIYYVTTNYRNIIENGWLEDLKYLCEPTEFHKKRITVHFTLPIGISREFCRHRVFSFAEMSTRYCNFNKNKFGNELTFIEDNWSNPNLLQLIETEYMKAIEGGKKPQEARNILPLCTKTELVMTGFVSDWNHFFRLRSRIAETGKPHPQAQELADPLMDEFVKRGIMEKLI